MALLNALLLLATALTIPGEPCSTEVPGIIVTTPCNMLMERLGPWYVSPPKDIELSVRMMAEGSVLIQLITDSPRAELRSIRRGKTSDPHD